MELFSFSKGLAKLLRFFLMLGIMAGWSGRRLGAQGWLKKNKWKLTTIRLQTALNGYSTALRTT